MSFTVGAALSSTMMTRTSLSRLPLMTSNRFRPGPALSLLIAAWFVVSQLASLGHQVRHDTGIDALQRLAAAEAAAAPEAGAAINTALNTTLSTTRSGADGARPGSTDRRAHGDPDASGHVAGDPTCLALAHLLSTAPPEGLSGLAVLYLPAARAGKLLRAAPARSRDHSPALPRGPPASGLIG